QWPELVRASHQITLLGWLLQKTRRRQPAGLGRLEGCRLGIGLGYPDRSFPQNGLGAHAHPVRGQRGDSSALQPMRTARCLIPARLLWVRPSSRELIILEARLDRART